MPVADAGPSSPTSAIVTLGDSFISGEAGPNAFGQRAIGRCVTLVWTQQTGNYTCRNTPGSSYSAMTLSSIP